MASPPVPLKWTGARFAVRSHTVTGPADAAQQSYARGPGAYWVASLDLVSMCLPDALCMRGFLNGLRGRARDFTAEIPGRPIAEETPFVWVCTPRVDGRAHFTDCTHFTDTFAFTDAFVALSTPAVLTIPGTLSGTLAVDAETATLTGLSRNDAAIAGQFVRLGDAATGQLVQIVSAVVTGAGPYTAAITFTPRARVAVANGTVCEIGRVTARWRLQRDDTPVIPLRVTGSSPFTLEIEEAY